MGLKSYKSVSQPLGITRLFHDAVGAGREITGEMSFVAFVRRDEWF